MNRLLDVTPDAKTVAERNGSFHLCLQMCSEHAAAPDNEHYRL
ncbi:hypothetical protein CSB95_6044 [Pseudomonas aeruginosa]|nr:hypothetical protein CSC29_6936 [Pseudomonas aeruginosa]PRW19303.1 hypothetical protein CSB95_6044 [Pseudomonas aeruginosa]